MTHQPSQASDTPVADYQTPLADVPASDSTVADPDRNLPVPRQSHIISTVLSPALRLWLRSQVEAVETLDVLIEGGDRQLLRGIVPRLTLMAQGVIYQGMSVSRLKLVGRGIQVNFRQLLRGKPLKLARVIPVLGETVLTEEDLNVSLQTSLLMPAVNDIFEQLLRVGIAPDIIDPESKKPVILDNFRVRLQGDRLTLGAEIVSATQGKNIPFAIRTGLRVAGNHQLRLTEPEWLPTFGSRRGLPLDDFDGYPLDLGTDLTLQDLTLEDGRLIFRGQFNVYPDPASDA
ncbi:LmeA family phospholipid-binding protein [Vacuolonema iberomarrocanum]|uniref:LmeA family phospholipid-binding protein n=1 Tax=Vacuolonema iberomarrocanum TaxID=3454632 RepID=UPI0019F91ED3|nr:DUF2993 domain-containing protein [filamentous cyanobacterium LEGE 07170]